MCQSKGIEAEFTQYGGTTHKGSPSGERHAFHLLTDDLECPIRTRDLA